MTIVNAKTQRARILRLLVDARGGWVPLPELLALGIAQYNARVWELRRLGFTIENRTETMDGQRHSWFRLVASPPQIAPTPGERGAESDFMRRRREEQERAIPLFAAARS